RAAACARRADRHCAGLRHEVPAPGRRARKDARDGRGRRDRAAQTHRTASTPIMMRAKPPFRADHVGSLLRSAPLKEARAKREKGEITPHQLRTIEDREIEAIIRKQEAAGLKSITDGEYRRA